MTTFDPAVLETLLYMAESNVLDFKAAQYPLAKATDEQKSELVKDVLAFANAWKTGDAHIVIGAKDGHGNRAAVTGVTEQLDDATVQQLVNGKTNRPISFAYIPVTLDGQPAAVIRIPTQQRPFFLKKDFGKLKAGVVYVRRGSSTDEANPDEVAQMGAAHAVVPQAPLLELQWADATQRAGAGETVAVKSKVMRPPTKNERESMRSLQEKMTAAQPMVVKLFREVYSIKDFTPEPSQEEREAKRAYEYDIALLQKLVLFMKNNGTVPAHDVRVILKIPKVERMMVVAALPEEPGPVGKFAFPSTDMSSTVVTDLGDTWEVAAAIKKIQPGVGEASDPFWLGSSVPGEVDLVARIQGDNVPAVQEARLRVVISRANGIDWTSETDSEDESED